MLDLETIRARLASQCAGLTKARLAADFAGARALQAGTPPEAFVGDYREQPGENISLSGTAQAVRCEFSVWLAVRRTTGATGELWQAALTTPEAQTRAALVDFEPTAEFSPLALSGSGPEQITRHIAWWRMTFQTTFYHCNNL